MGKKDTAELRFDVPFTAPAAPLLSESAGTLRLVAHASKSHNAEITLIDTPDNRLLRSDVVVAHQVVEGVGEWYLSAPGWQPWLPKELVVPVGGQADLPPEFLRLIRPVARQGVFGAVAGLICERSVITLKGTEDRSLAEITDEKVTIRRSGLTTARYRQVTIAPTKQLSAQQREFVMSAMAAISATAVSSFPTLQQRLGPPATGLTDFPKPRSLLPEATLEELVSSLFATQLLDLTHAALDLANDATSDPMTLEAELESTQQLVHGLGHVLEPEWCEQLVRASREPAGDDATTVAGRATATSELLAAAVHAPRLGDSARLPAAPLLVRRVTQATQLIIDRCDQLSTTSDNQEWNAALQATNLAEVTLHVALPLLGKPVRKLTKAVVKIGFRLGNCLLPSQEVDLAGLSTQEAFELGRAQERDLVNTAQCRADFVADWAEREKELSKQLAKMAKKL